MTDEKLHAALLANDSVQGVADGMLARHFRKPLAEVQEGLDRLARAERAVRVGNDYGSSTPNPSGLWRAR